MKILIASKKFADECKIALRCNKNSKNFFKDPIYLLKDDNNDDVIDLKKKPELLNQYCASVY